MDKVVACGLRGGPSPESLSASEVYCMTFVHLCLSRGDFHQSMDQLHAATAVHDVYKCYSETRVGQGTVLLPSSAAAEMQVTQAKGHGWQAKVHVLIEKRVRGLTLKSNKQISIQAHHAADFVFGEFCVMMLKFTVRWPLKYREKQSAGEVGEFT